MNVTSLDSFRTKSTLQVGDRTYIYFSLPALESNGLRVSHLPFSLRILLENLLRHEDGTSVTSDHVNALLKWDPKAEPETEISFMPARVILQDFTGVPAVVDFAAMRDAVAEMGGDPARINPLMPAELVIDHSVQVDEYGSEAAFFLNNERDYERNVERYVLLRWGQKALTGFRVVPPATGIVHQVNLENLARTIFDRDTGDGARLAYPDTVVGTDSHTTMINGLGVLGWGVGGIEAEAAMLGQSIPMLIPQVIGFRLFGALPEGATATDLVLTVTQMLRKKGVVGKFVEFYGAGLASLSLADRATIGNMSPEFGSTCAIFPIDAVTVDYIRFTGRPAEQVALVEAYAKAQGLYHTAESPDPVFTETLELNLADVVPSLAGPKRPQDRVVLKDVKRNFAETLPAMLEAARGKGAATPATDSVTAEWRGEKFEVKNGSVVIAAITSCTNTSNPSVMIGAGLVAKKAAERGLKSKPWVKTSLAPGSKVVTEYLKKAGLTPYLDALNFQLVGYGCTTCIGNSGPLPAPISEAVNAGKLVVAAVLSGNRNFEGRVNPDVRANYLASPPLVVAYALAGRMDLDLTSDPIGRDKNGKDVFLREIWPSQAELKEAMNAAVLPEQFRTQYADVFTGDEKWRALPVPEGDRFAWDPKSTYVRRPTFLSGIPLEPKSIGDIEDARVLAMLGDSVTTDHISPAGSIKKDSPAGRYLIEHGVDPKDFNSYGARRGNHEVMMRGTFANIRLRNRLVEREGSWTLHLPAGEETTIFDASVKYAADNVPLIILAGKEYGSGSSRDWAAKGTLMLGIRAVIAESFERIHRSNLIGMGVLPLQFLLGQNAATLGLSGREKFSILGIRADFAPGARLTVIARGDDNGENRFEVVSRIDTSVELDYYRNGGILPYVLRQLVKG
jgi:aconitate hydratase